MGGNLSRRALNTSTAAPRCSLEPTPVNSIYRFSGTFGPLAKDAIVLSVNFKSGVIWIGSYPLASIQIAKIPIPSISKKLEYTKLLPFILLRFFSMVANFGENFARLFSGGPSNIRCVLPIDLNLSFADFKAAIYAALASLVPNAATSVFLPTSCKASAFVSSSSTASTSPSSFPAARPSTSASIITSRSVPVSASCSSKLWGRGLDTPSGKAKLHA